MTGENLPDGCNELDIPGNSVDDEVYEKYYDDGIEELASNFIEEKSDNLVERIIEGSLLNEEFAQYCRDRFDKEKENER